MAILLFIYQNALWLAPPVLCLGIVLLIRVIVRLVRLVRRSFIVRLPLLERQTVDFAGSGKVVLNAEGPRLTRRFGGLRYALLDGSEQPVSGHFTLTFSTAGFSNMRVTVWCFRVPSAGRYTLCVDRLGPPQPKDAKHGFVFTRPILVPVVACVLGIIASSALTIGSLVLFLIRFFEGSPDTGNAAISPSAILIFAGITAVFVAAITLMIWSNQRHRKAVNQFAAAQGWPVSEADTLGLNPVFDALFPGRKFNACQTMTVESAARRIYLVDGSYSEQGPAVNVHLTAACLLESERLGAIPCRVEIRSRNRLDKALLPHQVPWDDSKFGRAFLVLAEVPDVAKFVLAPSVQQVLLDYAAQACSSPVEVAIGQGRMAVVTGAITENQRWLALLELAGKLESALPF